MANALSPITSAVVEFVFNPLTSYFMEKIKCSYSSSFVLNPRIKEFEKKLHAVFTEYRDIVYAVTYDVTYYNR